MIIKVGSLNEVKIEAVREVVRTYYFLKGAEIRGVDVESGVSAQPMNLEETIMGARNRAKNAFFNCEYGFGLESGLISFMGEGESKRYMDHTVCAIFDGQKYSLGFSPAFEMPQKIMELILVKGGDMQRATYEMGLTRNPVVGRVEGLVGLLSRGMINRKEYTKPAVVMALMGLQNPSLY